jgi:hypothetical protein
MTAPTPITLAEDHANEIRGLIARANDELSCIRKLLVGRYVRKTVLDRISHFYVVDVRLAGSSVQIFGTKRKGEDKEYLIGSLKNLEIVP